jgi:hypothetical protein
MHGRQVSAVKQDESAACYSFRQQTSRHDLHVMADKNLLTRYPQGVIGTRSKTCEKLPWPPARAARKEETSPAGRRRRIDGQRERKVESMQLMDSHCICTIHRRAYIPSRNARVMEKLDKAIEKLAYGGKEKGTWIDG